MTFLPLAKTVGIIGGATLATAFSIYAATGFYEVPEGMAAVETNGGKISHINYAGRHHLWPGFEGKVLYNTTQRFDIELKDLVIYYSPDEDKTVKPVSTDPKAKAAGDTATIANENAQQYTRHHATIRVSVNPEDWAVQLMHKDYGSMAAIHQLVEDRGIEEYKAIVRKIDPLKINTQRETIGPNTQVLLQQRLNQELHFDPAQNPGKEPPLKVDSVIFLESRLDPDVEKAFEKANQERAAIQDHRSQQEQADIDIETQRKQGEAVAARLKAEAQGEADAINIKGKALRDNPQMLPMRWIDAWEKGGSQVPETQVGQGMMDKMMPVLNMSSRPAPAPAGQ